MIPLAIPDTRGNEAKYLLECIETNFVSSVGPFVTQFEERVAQACSAPYTVATSSGTTGLHVALTALGVGRDDLVLLPTFTFIATANAVAHCGAMPWLVDIAANSWTMDPQKLQEAMQRHAVRHEGRVLHRPTGRRVAAIMPVYTLGTPADMDRIREIACEWGLPIVADAAAALGARYKGAEIAELADLTVFSFNGNKTVTAGGGGAVAGLDGKLLDLVRHLSTTARIGTDYDHDRVGFNYRMTNIQAAVGCAQMERLEEFVSAKRRIRADYDNAFIHVKGLELFPCPSWAESACWFSGLTLRDPNLPSIAEICARLRVAGIEARKFWKPIHLQAPYAEAPRSDVSVAEGLWEKVLTLPCSTSLKQVDQERVIQTLKGVLGV